MAEKPKNLLGNFQSTQLDRERALEEKQQSKELKDSIDRLNTSINKLITLFNNMEIKKEKWPLK